MDTLANLATLPHYLTKGLPLLTQHPLIQAHVHKLFKKCKIVLGESNGDWNKDLYMCTFPALISEWRRKWSENSPTNSKFPFGFVQLAAHKANYTGTQVPVLRWHQTADFGYVPNDVMQVLKRACQGV
jgi:hypothetical protein